jgi:hypothetical protein
MFPVQSTPKNKKLHALYSVVKFVENEANEDTHLHYLFSRSIEESLLVRSVEKIVKGEGDSGTA